MSYRKPTAITNKSGFTLIEVLVAMAVLIIGIMAISTMMLYSMKISQRVEDITDSTIFVSSLMNIIQVQDIDSLSVGQFSEVEYNGRPIIVNFSKMAGDSRLIRIEITLEMKNGAKKTFITYVTKK